MAVKQVVFITVCPSVHAFPLGFPVLSNLTKAYQYMDWLFLISPRCEGESCLVPSILSIGSGYTASLTRIKWLLEMNKIRN